MKGKVNERVAWARPDLTKNTMNRLMKGKVNERVAWARPELTQNTRLLFLAINGYICSWLSTDIYKRDLQLKSFNNDLCGFQNGKVMETT